ncbi:hypothetical protein HJ107_17780 [Vibrio parahaemolyticus]|nr:hypothetical protein [Vibrio parahaemolyticus]
MKSLKEPINYRNSQMLGLYFGYFTTYAMPIFIIFPLLYSIAKKNIKPIYVLIPLSFSVFAFYFNPPVEYDLYRHFEAYRQYLAGGVVEHIKDFYLLLLFYVGDFFKLPPNFMPLVSCYLLYYYLMKIARKINIRNNLSYNKSLLTVIFMLSAIPIVSYTGIRYSTGMILGLYGLYQYLTDKKVSGLLHIILGTTAHFSIVIPLLLLIFFEAQFYVKKIVRFLFPFLFLFALSIAFNPSVIVYVLTEVSNGINSFFGSNFIPIANYVSGSYGMERQESFNFIGMVIFSINKWGTMIIIAWSVFLLKSKNDKFSQYLCYLSVFCLFVSPFGTLFGRFGHFTLVLIAIRFLDYDLRGFASSKLVTLTIAIIFIFGRLIEVINNLPVFIDSYSSLYKISLMGVFYNVF